MHLIHHADTLSDMTLRRGFDAVSPFISYLRLFLFERGPVFSLPSYCNEQFTVFSSFTYRIRSTSILPQRSRQRF